MRKPIFKTLLVKIYCLVNPINGHVFYIGATKCTLKARLRGHLVDSSINPDNKKWSLICELKEKGIQPNIILIEEVLLNEAQKRESFWISKYKSYGNELYNRNKSNYTNTLKSIWKYKNAKD